MKKIFLIFLIFLLIPVVSAATKDIFLKNENIDLIVPCINNGTACSSAANCTITIEYPNSTILVQDYNMTNNNQFFNYTINSTASSKTGQYTAIMYCNDLGFTGYSLFNFDITTRKFNAETEGTRLIALIIAISLIIAYFIGITIITAKLSKFDLSKTSFWTSVISGFFALVELIFLLAIIYFNESGADLTNLLKLNFYSIALVGIGVGVTTTIIIIMGIFSLNKKDEKW